MVGLLHQVHSSMNKDNLFWSLKKLLSINTEFFPVIYIAKWIKRLFTNSTLERCYDGGSSVNGKRSY